MSLQEVMKSNALAEAVFKALAMRDRFRQVTDLRRLYNDVDKITHGKAEPEAFNEVVRNMEKAGLGRFVAGRKNNPDRFKWATKGVAKAIKEGRIEEIKPKDTKPLELEPTPLAEPVATPALDSFREAFGTITTENAVTYLNIRIPINVPIESLQKFLETLKSFQAS